MAPRRPLSREAKIIKPDTIVIRKHVVVPAVQDMINIAVISLCLLGVVLAMIGPKNIQYVINALISR